MFVRLDEEVSSAADVAGARHPHGLADRARSQDDRDGERVYQIPLSRRQGGQRLPSDGTSDHARGGLRPEYDTDFCFTNYEEVGHGAATVAGDADELLAVDMGCVGADLACKETQVSVCVKDSHGPYDYEMVGRLISLAKENKIDYAADVYPFYGSDVGAAWGAGADAKGGLIGPGVHASHGMERTHLKGMYNRYTYSAYLGLEKIK